MGGICSCFDCGKSDDEKREEERLSAVARAGAADAAERRHQDFEKSAAGRAAKAQMAAMAKQAANPSKGEPVLKNKPNSILYKSGNFKQWHSP